MVEQGNPAGFYEWQVRGKTPVVRLGLAVVDRLSLAVRESNGELPQRGVELGGLLLGRVTRSGGSTVVEIADFAPVACEHAAGPSYFLSAADRRELDRQIRRHRAAGGLSIVGFYRSNTRREFALTVEDDHLMADYFSRPSMVLLLIHAAPREPLKAGFFIWEERQIRSTKPYREFPFDGADLVAAGCVAQGVAAPQTTGTMPRLPLPRLQSSAPEVPKWPPRVKIKLRIALPKLATGLWSRLPLPARGSFWNFLGRRWTNSEAARVSAAILAGVLAGVLYQHLVTAPLATPTTPRHNRARSFPNRDMPSMAAPVTDVMGERSLPAYAVEPAVGPPEAAPRAIRKPNVQYRARAVLTAAAMAGSEAAPLAAPRLPDPPAISPGPREDAALPSNESALLVPEIPRVPDPFVTVTLDPPSDRTGLFGKLIGKRHKREGFVPPTLLHEPPLDVPPALRQRMRQAVSVEVKVYIDRSGKVQYAELLSKGTGRDRDAASLAVFSSRSCEFAPARQGDETVPSEMVLRYRFGGGGE